MEIDKTSPLVVTNASGYIASHLTKKLLEQGHKVRGTVCPLTKRAEYQFLYELVPEKKSNLSIVEIDFTQQTSYSAALKDCKYLFHIIPPLISSVSTGKVDRSRQVISETLNLLEVAASKNFTKAVVTFTGLSNLFTNKQEASIEDTWSEETFYTAYIKSKSEVEKALWDFHEKNKDKIQITIVNPVLAIGPVFSGHGSYCESLIADMLNGIFPGDMDVGLGVVDVRDVAEGQYKAMFDENAHGKKFVCFADTKSLKEIINCLEHEFNKYGYEMNGGQATLDDIRESESEVAYELLPLMGTRVREEYKENIRHLGINYRSIEEALIDMGYSLIKKGIVYEK